MEIFKNVLLALFLSLVSSLVSIGLWTLSVWYAHRDGVIIGFDGRPIDLGYLNQNLMHDLLQNPTGLVGLAILYYIIPSLAIYLLYKKLNKSIPKWIPITAVSITLLNPLTWIGLMFHST
ncbi:MAG: hypothetical protein HYT64_01685 [Candidatus Yanofskybacteria bacterium]|nr:hypothetical protein [Candidatus Yanofskybacteria bacterium]